MAAEHLQKVGTEKMQIDSAGRRFALAVMLSTTMIGAAAALDPQPASEIDYRREIWPIIKAKCWECHQAKKRQGSLDMSTRASMLKGGDSGAAFVPGNVEKSLMLELIEFGEMPPRNSNKPAVSKAEFQQLSRWVAAGAPVPDEPDPDEPDPTGPESQRQSR